MKKGRLKQAGHITRTALAVLLVVLLFIIPPIYTNSVFGYLPILFTLLLFLVSGIYLAVMKRKITIAADRKQTVTHRGESVKVDLNIRNNSILVCTKAVADIYVRDFMGIDDSFKQTTFSIDARSNADFGFDVRMDHVGVYTAGIRNMHVYGLLGILSIKIPFESDFSVTVLPRIYEEDSSLAAESLTDSPDASSYLENDGFDYTGVREYAMGDSMKKIHWKLSAHTSGYMTKINETGLKSDMAVLVDLRTEKRAPKHMLSVNDGLIETAASLLRAAEKKDIERSMVYPDKAGQLIRTLPTDDSDYAEILQKIHPITAAPEKGFPDGDALVQSAMSSASKAANVMICTSCMTPDLIESLAQLKAQQRNPMVFYILPEDAGPKARKTAEAALGGLSENGIYYEVRSCRKQEAVS